MIECSKQVTTINEVYMSRKEMTLKARLIRSIHDIADNSTVTVIELNKDKPSIVEYNGKRYNVLYDNLEVLDL